MKDLDKDVIYDLSDLNKEERTELFEYLLSVDKTYAIHRRGFIKRDKDLIFFKNDLHQWEWYDWIMDNNTINKIKNERVIINAKTLFAPKVNIINTTESENEKPKYKFQHVEVNKINDSIDLVFFKEKKNGLIKVKRITYFYSSNNNITDEYLYDVKISVIKFLEE